MDIGNGETRPCFHGRQRRINQVVMKQMVKIEKNWRVLLGSYAIKEAEGLETQR